MSIHKNDSHRDHELGNTANERGGGIKFIEICVIKESEWPTEERRQRRKEQQLKTEMGHLHLASPGLVRASFNSLYNGQTDREEVSNWEQVISFSLPINCPTMS